MADLRETRPPPLLVLPREVLLHLMARLDARDLLRLAWTSTTLRAIASINVLWAHLLHRECTLRRHSGVAEKVRVLVESGRSPFRSVKEWFWRIWKPYGDVIGISMSDFPFFSGRALVTRISASGGLRSSYVAATNRSPAPRPFSLDFTYSYDALDPELSLTDVWSVELKRVPVRAVNADTLVGSYPDTVSKNMVTLVGSYPDTVSVSAVNADTLVGSYPSTVGENTNTLVGSCRNTVSETTVSAANTDTLVGSYPNTVTVSDANANADTLVESHPNTITNDPVTAATDTLVESLCLLSATPHPARILRSIDGWVDHSGGAYFPNNNVLETILSALVPGTNRAGASSTSTSTSSSSASSSSAGHDVPSATLSLTSRKSRIILHPPVPPANLWPPPRPPYLLQMFQSPDYVIQIAFRTSQTQTSSSSTPSTPSTSTSTTSSEDTLATSTYPTPPTCFSIACPSDCHVHSARTVSSQTLRGVSAGRYRQVFTRVSVPDPPAPAWAGAGEPPVRVRQGVWVYGGHGLEFLFATVEPVNSEPVLWQLRFQKLTGDINVPRGATSLLVHLHEPLDPRRVPVRSQRPTFGMNAAGELSATHAADATDDGMRYWDVTAATEFRGRGPTTRGASAGSEEGEGEAVGQEQEQMQAFRAYATVALTGFRNSGLIEATVVIISPTEIAVVWHALHNVSQYKFVSFPELTGAGDSHGHGQADT